MFVLPSFNEGLPVALLEAMALGKACVASSINAIPEAVTDKRPDYLCHLAIPRALAKAISLLLDNDALRERIERSAQACAINEFDERRAASTTVEMYNRCLQIA